MFGKDIIIGDYNVTNISNNQIITLNRGDTFYAPLFINIGTQLTPMRYPLSDRDKIYVGIMEANQPFECALIKKVYTIEDINEHGDIVLVLKSEDTENLLPGTYYYQIKLQHTFEDESTLVDTIVPKRKLFLLS